MILDKWSVAVLEGSEPARNSLSAHVLDRSLSPITYNSSREVETTIVLDHNFFRPQFELQQGLATCSERRRVARDLARISGPTTLKEVIDKNEDKRISVMFTRGTKISSYTRAHYLRHPRNPIRPDLFAKLPEATQLIISEMFQPVILEFCGGKHDILTVNLSLNYPLWATEVRSLVFSDGCVMVLVDAGTQMPTLHRLREYMEHGEHPLAKFCPSRLGSSDASDTSSFVANPVPTNLLGFRHSLVFKDAEEYTTLLRAASELDHAPRVRQIKAYESSLKDLILVDFGGDPLDKEYEGLITRPTHREHPLQVGDTIKFQFEETEWNRHGSSWCAYVMPTGYFEKKGMLPVLIYRDQANRNGRQPKYVPRAIDATNLTRGQLQARVNSSTCDKVAVKIDDQDSVLKNIQNSQAAFPHDCRMKELFLGLRPDLLEVRDLYKPVEKHVTDPMKYMMPLNVHQMEVLEAARHILGGLLLVQGPPGTGKTWDGHNYLDCRTYEHWRNDLASGALKALARVVEISPHLKARRPYILRAHADKTEDEISRTQGPGPHKNPEPSGANQKTLTASTAVQERRAVLTEVRAASKPQFKGVNDENVARIEYSIGYMKLQISGVVPGSEYADPDSTRFARFRELYEKQSHGKSLSKEEELVWKEDGDKLTEIAVQGASAIISTTATLSKSALLGHVRKKVAAIFLDESAFEREDNLMPLFSTDFPLNPSIVMIGDQQQLEPLTMASEKDNPFRSQLGMSFMARMINLGMDYTMLTEQHRMVDQISAIANTLTYKQKLTNDPSTQMCHRPLARRFKLFTKYHYGISANRLLINVPPSLTNDVARNDKSSKSNDYFICIVADIIEKLLLAFTSTATIGVLTPYGAQRRGYRRMESNMRDAGLANFDRVTIDTIDKAQGQQYDIVVIDLVVGESAGFLESANRLNVAMTRAKDGLIIVCDKRSILTAFYKQKDHVPYMQKMIDLLKGETWNRQHDDAFPKTRWLVPTTADSTWQGKRGI